MISPPRIMPSAHRVLLSIAVLTKRTPPSANGAFTPRWWWLRAVMAPYCG